MFSQASDWEQIWRDIFAPLQQWGIWENLDFNSGSLALILAQSWFSGGLLILFGFPLSLLLSTEALYWLQKHQSVWLPLVRHVRNWLLPSFFINILLENVLQFSTETDSLKFTRTFFWVMFMYSILKLLDTLIFSEKSQLDLQKQVPKLLIDFLRLFLILLGSAFVLSKVWHLDLGQLLTALSVGSLVLGLALQNVVGSLFSGVALLSSRPFSVGDWIKIDNIEGKIISMDWRAVSLEDRQGDKVVIPNAMIAEASFRNYSQPTPQHTEAIGLNFSYQDPPNRVKACLIEAALATPHILKQPKPHVELSAYADTNIHYIVNYVIDDYAHQPDIHNDFISRIWYISQRHGLHFASKTPLGQQATTTEKKDDLLAAFKKLNVLDLPEEDQQILIEHARLQCYGQGEVILKAAEITSVFYIILSGVVTETLQTPYAKETLSTLRRGDFIGITNMIRHTSSKVTITVLEDVSVLAIDIHTMHNILQNHFHIAQHLENLVEMRNNRIKKLLEHRKQ